MDGERQKDKQIVKKKVYKNWTTKEDQRLLELRKKGLTYAEIGLRMNRSSISVERRYKRITYTQASFQKVSKYFFVLFIKLE